MNAKALGDQDLQTLRSNGWVSLDFDGTTADFLDFAGTIGSPIPSRPEGALVDRLIPTPETSARPRSMSARYGTGAFPFHTDAAYFRIPPKYIVLRAAPNSQMGRPTLLLDVAEHTFNPPQWSALSRDVWIVNGGRRRHLTPIVNSTIVPEVAIVRYDPECMRPYDPSFSESRRILEQYMAEEEPVVITWQPDVVVVIDNWRMLHARAAQPQYTENERVLERILIMQD